MSLRLVHGNDPGKVAAFRNGDFVNISLIFTVGLKNFISNLIFIYTQPLLYNASVLDVLQMGMQFIVAVNKYRASRKVV